jgi:pilus assembly protein FimV
MPGSAFPLGIGDISLHSALNQNLDAEISLHVSAGEKISDLQVKLAPPEKFDEAGVPWHYFLSKIKFEAVESKNGATVIKVTSKEILREPFLDFLVEVSWDKGNIYREFTVLVDPPVAYTQPVIPVIKQPIKSVNKKAVPVAKKVVKPVVPTTNKNKPSQAKPVAAKVRSKAFNGDKYGPVAKNEALWNVAERTNIYQGVTRAQMMVAIYQANPKAFYKNNINALKAGVTLKIPEREVILKLTKKSAQQIFKKQTDEWSGVVSAAKPKDKSTGKKNTRSGKATNKRSSLELKAPSDTAITGSAVVASGQGTQIDRSVVPTLEKTIVSLTEENSELQSKMKSLEQQLAAMENMLVLKGGDTAVSLNKQNELERAAEFEEAVAVAERASKSAVSSTTVPEPTVVTEPADINPVIAEPESVIPEESVAVDPPVSEPVILNPIVESEDDGFSSATIGALVLSALGLAGWGWWRKRKKEEDDFEDDESMFDSSSEIILSGSDSLEDEEVTASIDQVASLDNNEDTMDSSFLSEFTSSDFHTFDIDPGNDVDPVLEADVYLAYGRYQQAEELMRQAITDYPERDECKLKLLEIFHASDNQSAFEEYTIELEKIGKNQDQEFWAKVVEMGDELDVSSSDTVLDDKASSSIDNSDGDIVPEPMVDDAKNEAEGEEEEDIEFDLSMFDEMDSTLDDDTVELQEEEEQEALIDIIESKSEDNDDDFDLDEFDFDSPVTTTEKEKEKILDQVEGMETVDFDIDSFDLSSSEPSADTSKKEEGDTSNFESFDFDTDTVSDDKPKQSDLDLTDMDEMDTKIDLAKAYIDMGDYDAAKSIAQDAFDHGNDEQKKAAKNILDMLD